MDKVERLPTSIVSKIVMQIWKNGLYLVNKPTRLELPDIQKTQSNPLSRFPNTTSRLLS